LKGIVAMRGSGNSHVAILARALDLPTVMGAVDLPLFALDGKSLIVDGFQGHVYVNPSTHLATHYLDLLEEEREFSAELEELRDAPSVTKDGRRMQLWVNIGLVADISRSLDRRRGRRLPTEMPFATGDRFPTEEEQRLIYREHGVVQFHPARCAHYIGDKALVLPDPRGKSALGWRHPDHADHPEIFPGARHDQGAPGR
jgi:phosphotransferase system enzyme I (PtsP)